VIPETVIYQAHNLKVVGSNPTPATKSRVTHILGNCVSIGVAPFLHLRSALYLYSLNGPSGIQIAYSKIRIYLLTFLND